MVPELGVLVTGVGVVVVVVAGVFTVSISPVVNVSSLAVNGIFTGIKLELIRLYF